MTDPENDAEWSFLELVAYQQGRDVEPDERTALIDAEGFDHDLLIAYAIRHGLLVALVDYVHRHGQRRSLPVRFRNPLMSALYSARHRALVMSQEASMISDTLQKAGAKFAFTKGIVLQSRIFGNTAVRAFNDIDLMIDSVDRQLVREALGQAGFREGAKFNPYTGELNSLPRGELRIYQLFPDHLPPFYRLRDDTCAPVVKVDVANSLTWHGSPWLVPTTQALQALEPTRLPGNLLVPSMSDTYSFLFVCLHVFREGWLQRAAELKDLSLAQFADVQRYWEILDATSRSRIVKAVADHGLEEPIAWVCGHTDLLFGSTICEELSVSEFASKQWLQTARAANGKLLSWQGTMRDRLRMPTPVRLAPTTKSVSGERPA